MLMLNQMIVELSHGKDHTGTLWVFSKSMVMLEFHNVSSQIHHLDNEWKTYAKIIKGIWKVTCHSKWHQTGFNFYIKLVLNRSLIILNHGGNFMRNFWTLWDSLVILEFQKIFPLNPSLEIWVNTQRKSQKKILKGDSSSKIALD